MCFTMNLFGEYRSMRWCTLQFVLHKHAVIAAQRKQKIIESIHGNRSNTDIVKHFMLYAFHILFDRLTITECGVPQLLRIIGVLIGVWILYHAFYTQKMYVNYLSS